MPTDAYAFLVEVELHSATFSRTDRWVVVSARGRITRRVQRSGFVPDVYEQQQHDFDLRQELFLSPDISADQALEAGAVEVELVGEPDQYDKKAAWAPQLTKTAQGVSLDAQKALLREECWPVRKPLYKLARFEAVAVRLNARRLVLSVQKYPGAPE